ncbi:hypothetical protein AYO45_04760 [Gammaproteobacteria bacterium SCGC AG-212-F23]|nr:hypothetical protein AYO45_04760 [Gammaproteobacteria bacterium SCGC AG-212-F23]
MLNRIITPTKMVKFFPVVEKSIRGHRMYSSSQKPKSTLNAFQLPSPENEFKAFLSKAEQGDSLAQYRIAKCYLNGVHVSKDRKKAFEWYEKSANNGNSYGQYMLAYCYDNGISVPKNDKLKVFWFEKAANQNHTTAQFFLGQCYLLGIGTIKNEGEAFLLFKKAADKNHSDAQHALGECFLFGIGTPKNNGFAADWFRKAAEQNNAKGQYRLAYCYLDGIGTTLNAETAFIWLKKAAENNLVNAQFEMGECERNSGYQKEALEWYKKAASNGSLKAEVLIGDYYTDVDKDEKKAFERYRIAAAKGSAEAEFKLGLYYQNGKGTLIDAKKAFEHIKNAAEKNLPEAAAQLSEFYMKGFNGITTDEKESLKWREIAANGGIVTSQWEMGLLCEAGIGIKKDAEKALIWYQKALKADPNYSLPKAGICQIYVDNKYFPDKKELSTLCDETEKLMQRYPTLNFVQAAVLQIPEIQGWCLMGIQSNLPIEIFQLIFTYICLFPADSFRVKGTNNLHIVGVKSELERKLDIAPHLQEQCIKLNTSVEDSDKIVTLLDNQIADDEKHNRVNEPLYKLCKLYLPFFKKASAKSNSSVLSSNTLSIHQIQPPY